MVNYSGDYQFGNLLFCIFALELKNKYNMAKINKKQSNSSFNTYITIGAHNHVDIEREENDFYATPPKATRLLMELETFNHNIWEVCCGMNHITNILKESGYNVRTSDIIDRVNDGNIEIIDFLSCNEKWQGDIVTNPPYKFASEFVYKAMECVENGCKVAMFLKLTFMETKARKELFKQYPPKVIYVSSSRLGCSSNGDFNEDGNATSAIAYCWYIWEKGYKGDTIIKWFN